MRGEGVAMALGVMDAVMDGLSAEDRPLVARAYVRKYATVAALADPPELSTAEWRVLRFTAEGLTSSQIARRMNCAHRTAEQRVISIRRKLGAVNRVDMVVKAMRMGML
jgi:DNA-binding NarL/FixJ family response regulator